MSGIREVRTKINSIASTQKITSAMEMVAASKMRRAQELMQRSRPYADKLRQLIQHVASSRAEYSHTYMAEREVKRVGIIIVATDRGLCGGLNINVFKHVIRHMQSLKEQDIDIELCTIGNKAIAFFRHLGGNIAASISGIGDTPRAADLIGGIKIMLDTFVEKRIDQLLITSNRFINTMSQKPSIEQLLPLPIADTNELKHYWDYIYEPDARELLDSLMSRYIESLVYQTVVENLACEQAARMVAMKNATENARELIDEFQLIYNKARQTSITQELAEIVGGAAAVAS